MPSYSDIAQTVGDGAYQQRLIACATEQAQVFVNDERPEFKGLAEAVLADANTALGMTWLVASAPVAGDLGDDAVLLSAVQYAWPLFGATYAQQP